MVSRLPRGDVEMNRGLDLDEDVLWWTSKHNALTGDIHESDCEVLKNNNGLANAWEFWRDISTSEGFKGTSFMVQIA